VTSTGQYVAHIVSSTHVAADSFAKTCQEVLLVAVVNLLNDAECIHLLFLTHALCDQRKCISTIYKQSKLVKTTPYNTVHCSVLRLEHRKQ